MTKKFLSLILIVTLVLSTMILTTTLAASESQITSPSNNDWLDCWSGSIVIKWTAPSSGHSNKITILNTRTNEYIVRNKQVSGTSYSISKQTLDFEENYKIWVGTFNGDNAIGAGSVIFINTLPINQSKLKLSSITSPSNGEWLDCWNDNITIKWSSPDDGLKNKITIVNTRTNEYIVQNKVINGTSYTIPKRTLDCEEQYKIWVGTFSGEEPMSSGSIITINTMPRQVTESAITSPANNTSVDNSKQDVIIKWTQPESGLTNKITILNTDNNKYLVQNIKVTKTSYVVSKNTLEPNATYKIWVGTFDGETAIGKGDTIMVSTPALTTEEKTNDQIQITKYTWKINESTATGSYEIIGENFDYANIVIESPDSKEIHNKDYSSAEKTIKIDLSNFVSGKYKCILRAFDLNGNEAATDTATFFYEPEIDLPEISDASFTTNENSVDIEYNVIGENFGYVKIFITDENNGSVYNHTSQKKSDSLTADFSDMESGTYTGKIICYNTESSESDSNVSKFTYTKKEIKSEFGVQSVVAPEGELNIGEGFTASAIITSNLPITKLKISIYEGETDTTVDSVEKKNYSKTAADPKICNIEEYSSQIDFSNLDVGNYTYVVEVTNENDETYTAVKSSFSIVDNTIIEGGLFTDVPNTHMNYESIAKLTEMGVISGYNDGSFRPDRSITRAEFVKMLCTTFGLGTSDGSSFDDTETHWAKKYIKKAKDLGIVSGKGNNNFAPEDNVTYEEAAKMLVCVKGWENHAKKNGAWPDGYIFVALNNSLFNSTNIQSTKAYASYSTRSDIAQMMYNTFLRNEVSTGSLIDTLADEEIYVKQQESTTCTLASMVMTFRRRAILDENEYWWMIREDTLKEQGNWRSGLVNSPKYVNDDLNLNLCAERRRINYTTAGIVNTNTTPRETINTVKQYMDEHPEGVVLFVSKPSSKPGINWSHAVSLIRYEGDTFYCAEPANKNYAGKEINLMNSFLVKQRAKSNSIEELFSNCVAIWYVTKH